MLYFSIFKDGFFKWILLVYHVTTIYLYYSIAMPSSEQNVYKETLCSQVNTMSINEQYVHYVRKQNYIHYVHSQTLCPQVNSISLSEHYIQKWKWKEYINKSQ